MTYHWFQFLEFLATRPNSPGDWRIRFLNEKKGDNLKTAY
jgi:hypothetical protein